MTTIIEYTDAAAQSLVPRIENGLLKAGVLCGEYKKEIFDSRTALYLFFDDYAFTGIFSIQGIC